MWWEAPIDRKYTIMGTWVYLKLRQLVQILELHAGGGPSGGGGGAAAAEWAR